MSKYLSMSGLEHLWEKIKTLLNGKQNLIQTKTENEWGTSSVVPAAGEIVIVKDKNSIKVGDGLNTVSGLSYVGGLMTSADKTKLDGIASGANAYTHPTYTAKTGKPTGDQTPSFGDTVTVSQVTSDSTGHVTGMTDRTITIPDSQATDLVAGLMSAADKSKLDSVETGAQPNPGQATTSAAGLMSATDKTKLNGIETGANKYIHPSHTAYTGKPSTDLSPGFGGVVTISQITSDSSGHVTAANDIDITIPDTAATQSSSGLMSAADKTKLDGVATGANAYEHPAYTARTGKPTANQSPNFGGSVTISQVTSDASGHITGMTDRTITIPSTAASQSVAGLMSASDKTKLDGIASGAQVNQNAFGSFVIDGTTVGAVSASDFMTITSGSNITLTPDDVHQGLIISATDTVYQAATTSLAGLMSAADKTKLDGIEMGAQAHIAPTAAEVKAALGTGSGTTKYLREDGTWVDPSTPFEELIDYAINLNTMRTVGHYTFNSSATVTNRPDTEPYGVLGELFVFSNGQYFRAGNHFYMRNHRSGNTWGDWIDLATSDYYIFSVKTSLDFTNGYAVYENSKIKSTSRVFVMGNNSGTTGVIFSTAPANGYVTIAGMATYNVPAPTLSWSGTKSGIQILIDNR